MNAHVMFWAASLLMTGVTLAVLLRGLWRARPEAGPVTDGSAGIAVLREQLAGVELDLAQGRIDAAGADAQRADIARRLLQEQDRAPGTSAPWRVGPSRGAALALALAVPALALALYGGFGEPLALTQAPRAPAAAQPTMTQVESMVSQMTQALEGKAQRGEAGPEDGAAWGLAARTLASLQRFPEADKAFARALALVPDDPHLLADRADILSLLQSGSPEGEPMRLITRALQLDPGHPKARALAGSAAWARGDAALAAEHWGRALQRLDPESEFAQGLTQSLAQARQKAPAPPQEARVRGRITLDPALRAQTQPNDTVFIVARAVEGPRMPLAILRLRVADLPAPFTLDDSSAMAPALRLSAVGQVVVSARVTRSGEALTQTGDLVGTPVTARVGAQGLELRIDRVQP